MILLKGQEKNKKKQGSQGGKCVSGAGVSGIGKGSRQDTIVTKPSQKAMTTEGKGSVMETQELKDSKHLSEKKNTTPARAIVAGTPSQKKKAIETERGQNIHCAVIISIKERSQ